MNSTTDTGSSNSLSPEQMDEALQTIRYGSQDFKLKHVKNMKKLGIISLVFYGLFLFLTSVFAEQCISLVMYVIGGIFFEINREISIVLITIFHFLLVVLTAGFMATYVTHSCAEWLNSVCESLYNKIYEETNSRQGYQSDGTTLKSSDNASTSSEDKKQQTWGKYIKSAFFWSRKKADQDESKTEEPQSLKWRKVFRFLEKAEYTSLVSRLTHTQLSSDRLRLPNYESIYAAVNNLGKISTYLHDIEIEIGQHRLRATESLEDDEDGGDNKGKKNKALGELKKLWQEVGILQELRMKMNMTLAHLRLLNIIRVLLPAFMAFVFFTVLLVSVYVFLLMVAPWFTDAIKTTILSRNHFETIFDFGLGLLLIAGAFHIALFASIFINWFLVRFWLSASTREYLLVYHLVMAVLSSIIFLFVLMKGFDYLVHLKDNSKVLPGGETIVTTLEFAKHLAVPFSQICHDWLAPADGAKNFYGSNFAFLLGLRFLAAVSIAYILTALLIYGSSQYESNFFDREHGHGVVPPELIRIFGAFAIFVIVAGHLYMSFLAYSEDKAIASLSLQEKLFEYAPVDLSPNGNKDKCLALQPITIASDTGAPTPVASGSILSNSGTSSLNQLLPFSLFIALLGTGVALATREILENYFAGLALRVDQPYTKGDRVFIENLGMCEVMEKRLRASKLYVINNNSVVYVPHKKMASMSVENFHQPTLDYRREINFRIPISPTKTKNPKSALELIENLLLTAAMAATGVMRPRPEFLEFEDLTRQIEIERSNSTIKKKDYSVLLHDIKKVLPKAFEIIQKISDAEDQHKKNPGENPDMLEPEKRYLRKLCLEEVVNKYKENKREYLVSEGDRLEERFESYKLGKLNSKEIRSPLDYLPIDPTPKYDEFLSPIEFIWRARFGKNYSDLLRPPARLFIDELDDLLEETLLDNDNEQESALQRLKIKMIVAEIVCDTARFDRYLSEIMLKHSKAYIVNESREQRVLFALKSIINHPDNESDLETFERIGKFAARVSYNYFLLAKELWTIKEKANQNGHTTIRKLDHVALKLLDAPRVTGSHMITEDGKTYWNATLVVTLELAEQSDEIIHHINMIVENLLDVFQVPRSDTPQDGGDASIGGTAMSADDGDMSADNGDTSEDNNDPSKA